jgi:glucoamylase
VVFDRIEPAYQRYVAAPVPSRYEIWTFRHQTRVIAHMKTLRVLTAARALVHWTSNGWKDVQTFEARPGGLSDLFVADIATAELPAGTSIEFTFHWPDVVEWEGRNFSVSVK